jgi:site-specific DNA-methyltransferase (adenine-specific)
MDCREFMAKLKDKSVDLLFTDPPYFEGPNKLNYYGPDISSLGVDRQKYNLPEKWDVPGEEEYNEFIRISKEQIIFGINYFEFSNKIIGRIIWNKKGDGRYSNDFSDGEIASVSCHERVKIYHYLWSGMIQQDMRYKEKKFHPTQKPVKLLEQVLLDYTKEGDLICDCYMGSGSLAVACINTRRNFIGCELDKHYFDIANERIGIAKDKSLKPLEFAGYLTSKNRGQLSMFKEAG